MTNTDPFRIGIFYGLEIPLGLGLLRLSTSGQPADLESLGGIRSAFNQGIRLVDTADVYCQGENDLHYGEHIVRQVLRTWSGPRHEVRVLTKVGLSRPGGQWIPNGRPEHLLQSVDGSLQAATRDEMFDMVGCSSSTDRLKQWLDRIWTSKSGP